MDKTRLLAISKSDFIDQELREGIKSSIPNIPWVFISSLTGEGIKELKDLLWKHLNESNHD